MSSFLNIQTALENKLATSVAGLPIAAENTKYVPTLGTAWCRSNIVANTTQLVHLDSLYQEITGIYQIDLFYPINKGSGPALTKADVICSAFKATSYLTKNNDKIYIKNINRRPAVKIEDAWYMVAIEVNFFCIENNT